MVYVEGLILAMGFYILSLSAPFFNSATSLLSNKGKLAKNKNPPKNPHKHTEGPHHGTQPQRLKFVLSSVPSHSMFAKHYIAKLI